MIRWTAVVQGVVIALCLLFASVFAFLSASAFVRRDISTLWFRAVETELTFIRATTKGEIAFVIHSDRIAEGENLIETRRAWAGPFSVLEWTQGTPRRVVATACIAPFWFPPLLMLAYPATAFMRGPARRWRRRRAGLCVKCGYDLTGNVSGVCSECGIKT